jgi:ribosomal protein S18 acetylase RimI-like enzyme
MEKATIRQLEAADEQWVKNFVIQRWGAPVVVGHGVTYTVHHLPGFVTESGTEKVGLLTYFIEEGECEVVTLDSLREGQGIGTALIEAVKTLAVAQGCHRLWLITTNDNLNALRFFQKRGFELVALNRGAVTRSRQLKPQIPLLGADGIPLRDELELEMPLG